MAKRRIAYLAPELPSASAAFVHEEINLLREAGHEVFHFAVRPPVKKSLLPPDAIDIAKHSTSLQKRVIALGLIALKFMITHPVRAWRGISMATQDMRFARFDGRERPLSIPARMVEAMMLADRLVAQKAEHLHIHFSGIAATIGMYAACMADISFSVTAHDADLYCHASLLDKKLERASAFTTVSLANRGYLLELLGTSAAKIRVIHCGVNIDTFAARSAESGADSNVVFAAGPLVPRKGFDVLLYALALLGDTRPDIRIAIAGSGTQRPRLEELAERLHIRDRVSLLGKVSRDDIRTHLAAAGLFALPCRSALSGDRDAIPVSLIEAMACSVPVVSTRFSGIPELVEHERSGLLVDPDDPVDLAAAIVRLLDDAPLRKQLQAAARQRVMDRFNLTDTVEQLAEVFEGAIQRHAAEKAQRADTAAKAPSSLIPSNPMSAAAGASA
jgi:glycosyltransferase involved in cell wall biosynthesis